MKHLTMLRILLLAVITLCYSCNEESKSAVSKSEDKLERVLDSYWQERMKLFPFEATASGDNRYNDRLTITISESFRDSLRRFYGRYLAELSGIDSAGLDKNDMVSYRLLKYEMLMGLEGLKHPTHLMPMNQFWSFTLEFPQMGSGTGNQPFKTVQDYDNWLKRMEAFPAWVDTAIFNMRKGLASGWVLPKSLVVKIMPQVKAVIVEDTASIFYGPLKTMPSDFSDADRQRLKESYTAAIGRFINPSYLKLHDFFEKEYLPNARTGSGINDLPGGSAYYKYCIKLWTTTDMLADSIYNIGIREVARIESEMMKIKDEVGYKGNLQSFFKYLNDDKRFCPFTSAQAVIDSFWNIKRQEGPQLKQLFNDTPETQFTVRQTEAFRAASASAEYNPGSEDGSRPGIFYVPVINAAKYNCVGMATLFLHEAIPGHHYQISLQQENRQLPKFRRFLWYGAYGEGWAHYCETLGKELGVYNDPYQYFGHLSDAMHRAIRLVVDVGIHAKGMTREEAIKYMMAHEQITERDATAEIERYMAIPGQALSYKVGQLAITGERNYYTNKLGAKFHIASFHQEVLSDGCVPLNILHEKLDEWSEKQ